MNKKFPVCLDHLPTSGGFAMQSITGDNTVKCCKCENPAKLWVTKLAEKETLVQRLSRLGHIQKLQGKDYILLSGLLMLAHENGLKEVKTHILEHDRENRFAVVQAVVSGSRGTYTATGDADPTTCGKKVANAYLRMAETRAIARAMRWYTGVGMTAREELPPQQRSKKQEANNENI